MLVKDKSYGEVQYPTFNWETIWKNFCSTIFNPYEKEIIFKHLHLCLATNERLAMIGRSTTSNCTRCTGNMNHTALHMFYQYESIQPLFLWLLRVLLNISNFKPISNIKLLYYDVIYDSLYQKTVCNIFLYIYIITVWKNRKENLRIGILKYKIIRKVIEHLEFLKHIPNKDIEKTLKRMARINIENLVNI